jgi:RHS repeat-associated protein
MKSNGLQIFIFWLLLNLPIAPSLGETEYFHPDSLGSNPVVSNDLGALIHTAILSPDGESLGESGVNPVSFLYTGQGFDRESNTYDYGARCYDPILARFLSVDPLNEGPNLYAYVGHNPIRFNDPTGKRGESWDEKIVRNLLPMENERYLDWKYFNVDPDLYEQAYPFAEPLPQRSLRTLLKPVDYTDIGDGMVLAFGETPSGEKTWRGFAVPGLIFGSLLSARGMGEGAKRIQEGAAIVLSPAKGGLFIDPGARIGLFHLRPKRAQSVIEYFHAIGAKNELNRFLPVQQGVYTSDVRRYAEAMAGGEWDWSAMEGPIRVFELPNESLVLGDGHHRFLAATAAGMPIPESAISYEYREQLPMIGILGDRPEPRPWSEVSFERRWFRR